MILAVSKDTCLLSWCSSLTTFFSFLAEILHHDRVFGKWLDSSPFFHYFFWRIFFYSISSVFFSLFFFLIYPLFHGSLSVFCQFLVFYHIFYIDDDLCGFLSSSWSWRELFATLRTFCWWCISFAVFFIKERWYQEQTKKDKTKSRKHF